MSNPPWGWLHLLNTCWLSTCILNYILESFYLICIGLNSWIQKKLTGPPIIRTLDPPSQQKEQDVQARAFSSTPTYWMSSISACHFLSSPVTVEPVTVRGRRSLPLLHSAHVVNTGMWDRLMAHPQIHCQIWGCSLADDSFLLPVIHQAAHRFWVIIMNYFVI